MQFICSERVNENRKRNWQSEREEIIKVLQYSFSQGGIIKTVDSEWIKLSNKGSDLQQLY